MSETENKYSLEEDNFDEFQEEFVRLDSESGRSKIKGWLRKVNEMWFFLEKENGDKVRFKKSFCGVIGQVRPGRDDEWEEYREQRDSR